MWIDVTLCWQTIIISEVARQGGFAYVCIVKDNNVMAMMDEIQNDVM
jgi:hypothetical protein